MPDLKLGPGALWALPLFDMPAMQCAALNPAVQNFMFNARRIHAFSTLLSNMIVPTIVIERAMAEEKRRLETNGLILGIYDYAQCINNAINDSLRRFNAIPRGYKDPVSPEYKDLIDNAYMNIQYFSDTNEVTHHAIKAWFYAQITGIWTAFEVLIGDLWEAAVNQKPSKLHGQGSVTKLGNAIFIERLVQYNFDISDKLGTLLREKIKFDKLDVSIEHYANSFCVDGEDIIECISHPSIRTLGCMRHIIVHNAARFDSRYIDSVKSLPMAPKGDIGAEMNIDAEVVYNALHPVVGQAKSLIIKVNNWIMTH